ncbi:MAG: HXXEE domain-containing protein [Syntrophobacterales bacterium]|nr:MAG: HXXEE domain-containing protein [Syntrophobacterales bacterium]
MDFITLSWTFAVAVTVHNLEEALFLPQWSEKAGRWHPPVGAREFRFAVTILTLFAFIVAYWSASGPRGGIGAYLVSGYALAMLLNVVFPHLAATLFMRRYMPGTATSVLFVLPITSLLLYRAFFQGYIVPSLFVYIGPGIVAGIMLSIPILFIIGRKVRGDKKTDAV